MFLVKDIYLLDSWLGSNMCHARVYNDFCTAETLFWHVYKRRRG